MHAEQLPAPGAHEAPAAQATPAPRAAPAASPVIGWPDLALPPINLYSMPRLAR